MIVKRLSKNGQSLFYAYKDKQTKMNKIRVTKLFHFEMAHALEKYDGLCRNIHGHSYKLWVTVTGILPANPNSPKDGMLIDFSDLKHIVQECIVDKYDHALVLNVSMDTSTLTTLQNHYQKVITTDYQPTSEQLLISFAKTLQDLLPANIVLHSLRLQETETSFAEWFAQDNRN
jgi:6-pyruvoyltetrahydropterin/6-carboxytetrahydropterin synthase